MSHAYKTVQWNRQKIKYDTILWGILVAYLVGFVGISLFLFPKATPIIIGIRAFGTAAFVLLHVILSIGPLARLNPYFLPILYNRRHLGVSMSLLATAHAGLAVMFYHSFGSQSPLLNVFIGNTQLASISQFPFQLLGVAALIIIYAMAATSHDFWLANLTAPVWKTLHMMVYVAYGLLVGHVALGFLQTETHGVYFLLVALGFVWIAGCHVVAGVKEYTKLTPQKVSPEEWVDVCKVGDIAPSRAKIILVSGERVAVFNNDGIYCAVSNACQHQNGPLGEGRIIAGCITCPWHGYQYDPNTGASPPPFTEKVPVFQVKVVNDTVYVSTQPAYAKEAS